MSMCWSALWKLFLHLSCKNNFARDIAFYMGNTKAWNLPHDCQWQSWPRSLLRLSMCFCGHIDPHNASVLYVWILVCYFLHQVYIQCVRHFYVYKKYIERRFFGILARFLQKTSIASIMHIPCEKLVKLL